ncbi:MAG: type II toxin-antitoxin system HigB family toxin [Bacteroidia bacterium]|nr:type II toxin-antitoxin system HigB family toxin [Bacteroidia bacterium]
MKIHVVRAESVHEYVATHARSRSSMTQFLKTLEIADWQEMNDIKSTFGSFDAVCGGKRVVFNVGGNNFRIICGIKFRSGVILLYIKFIGTHAEYTKLCNAKANEPGICEVEMYKARK